ncbi:MAG: hypothetical protein IJ874_02600 [Ruminococcus sp.]|nr:hypothetical protein [Ruminococcus sp.]
MKKKKLLLISALVYTLSAFSCGVTGSYPADDTGAEGDIPAAETDPASAQISDDDGFSDGGTVLKINGGEMLIDLENAGLCYVSGEELTLPEGLSCGDIVHMTYDGNIAESYPGQITSAYSVDITVQADRELEGVSFATDGGEEIVLLLPEEWSCTDESISDDEQLRLHLSAPGCGGLNIVCGSLPGLCGTGIHPEKCSIGGLPATIYVQDYGRVYSWDNEDIPVWSGKSFWETIIPDEPYDRWYILSCLEKTEWERYSDDVGCILRNIWFI